MAANQIVQRLVAAGTSPQRAQQFANQYAARFIASGGKPKDVQDAFDAELGAIAAAKWPMTFRPPSIDSPEIDDYITGIYGPQTVENFTAKSLQSAAPGLYKVLQKYPNIQSAPDNTLPLDAWIVKKVYIEQRPVGEIKSLLADSTLTDPTDKTGKKLLTGNLLPSEYGALVDKYATEDREAYQAEQTAKQNFLKNDKYYSANLPHPKLVYGKETDLSKGVISWKTHPAVAQIIETETPKYAAQDKKVNEFNKTIASSPAAGYIKAAGPEAVKGFVATRKAAKNAPVANSVAKFEDDVFNQFVKSGAKPFVDEVKRRESLKKTTTLGS